MLQNVMQRRAGAVSLLALAGLVAAACSSSGPTAGGSATSTTAASAASALAPEITSSTVVINGHTYQVPTEDGVHPISSGLATGGQIVITDKGFLPHRLFANLNQTITWTNLSSRPVRITFLHLPTKSGLIPIGGTFTYSSPTLINFQYVSSSGHMGLVGIGDFVP